MYAVVLTVREKKSKEEQIGALGGLDFPIIQFVLMCCIHSTLI